ncbi:DUF397 domain-containing protein [Streptomyces sp. N2-109]|uniref:DUF397 domain-containing protein n=1 Tax=Streptomyces gossypii TaxID=2883101 RepID=A0ABT2JYX3_9ACTN|nr:DUF397 domain-containing protein [Streptomyces gossypii]MCT2592639.1 DUF397 domain-containing protein [Streptomyces gossypii]
MNPPPNWQKSSFSGTEGDCIELAALGSSIAVRESDRPAETLATTPVRLAIFLAKVKAGAFNRA